MSVRVGIVSLLVLVTCALFVAPVGAQGTAPHFIISGSSTVRQWACPADGTEKIVPGQSAQAVPGFPHGLQAVEITVPVKAIACEEPRMNEHLRESLNEPTYPLIVYKLEHYELNGNDAAKATGTLTIYGQTKPVTFDVKFAPAGQSVHVTGETWIDLTQFGITPPVIFEGLLKVGKDVRIRFDAVL